jgi:hypothetical protein
VNLGKSNLDLASISSLANTHVTPPNMAKYAVDAVYKEILDFEASLDDNHEMGMSIVGGPAGVCLHVREIYRYGTDKLVFDGMNSDGSPLRLMQHLSQLNFLMISTKKIGQTAARIGFHELQSDI